MHKYTFTVLLILVFMSISFPAAYAVTGKVQIVTTNAPTKVIADLNFQLNVSLRITCTSTTDNILARIDILPHGSHQVVASNSLGLGSIPDPWAKKTWNITMTSNLHSPASLGAWMLEVRAWVFAGVYPIALDNQTIMIQVVTRSSQVQVITASASNSTTSTSVSSSSALDRQTNSDTFIVTIPQTSLKMIAPLFAVGAVAASVTIVVRKRKTRSEQENSSEKIITVSTGYPEVDKSLGGGVPIDHSIIIVSPPYDERDLLIEKVIASSIHSGFSVFFVSREILRTSRLTRKFKDNFYAFNPRADKISGGSNVIKIMDVQNPNDVNISLAKAMAPLLDNSKKKLIILDHIVSDILLEHKALTTRRWLDEFLTKRKTEGFTVIVTLNPLMVADQERQAIIDLFDGVIVIYEKELPEQSKRYLVIRKMYARKYSDVAIELERD